MIQEIITYLIVAVAVTVAVRLLYKKMDGIRSKRAAGDGSPKSSTPADCGSCIADCPLRDSMSKGNTPDKSCNASVERESLNLGNIQQQEVKGS